MWAALQYYSLFTFVDFLTFGGGQSDRPSPDPVRRLVDQDSTLNTTLQPPTDERRSPDRSYPSNRWGGYQQCLCQSLLISELLILSYLFCHVAWWIENLVEFLNKSGIRVLWNGNSCKRQKYFLFCFLADPAIQVSLMIGHVMTDPVEGHMTGQLTDHMIDQAGHQVRCLVDPLIDIADINPQPPLRRRHDTLVHHCLSPVIRDLHPPLWSRSHPLVGDRAARLVFLYQLRAARLQAAAENLPPLRTMQVLMCHIHIIHFYNDSDVLTFI